MPRRQRLTNNSDETEIASLLSGDSIFAIPYFQRAYKWKPERLAQLNRDLLSLVDGSSDYHFLGAIIIHGRRSNPSEPSVYDVIDGQQRVTTLFLYLCAVVRVLSKAKEYQEASGLFLKYLAIGRATELASNAKLHPCKDDRSQLNAVFNDLLSDGGFADKIAPFSFQALPTSSPSAEGRLRKNYRAAVRFFDEQVKLEGLDRLRSLYKALLELISVVQIDVWDPTNGPKIFDSLNSRQEPMTTGDLVRNEIFSRVADQHPDTIERIDQDFWQPFYNKFKDGEQSTFDAYFFPYGLIQSPNLKKSEVYTYLRKLWDEIKDPKIIIKELCEYQDAFLDIATGGNRQEHAKPVAAAFNRLYQSGAPGSAFPFLMQLSNGIKSHQVEDADGIAVIETVESFLVRRAICGHEPTGLHAVFKRLWEDCGGTPNEVLVAKAIRSHKTVVWPGDEEVERAVMERDLYSSGITQYVLLELNRSRGGDQPGPGTTMWIEHVLPENPVEEWFEIFSKQEHEKMKDRLGNLLPLTSEMNRQLGNRVYPDKRSAYIADSGYKVTREFGAAYENWRPQDLEFRAQQLAQWAKERWAR